MNFAADSSPSGGKQYDVKAISESTENIKNVYHFLETLGEGSYGCVYNAVLKTEYNQYLQDPESVAQFAIKQMKKNKIDDSNRFMDEIRTMIEVQHPNVIRLFAVFQDQKHIFLVMEKSTGGELFDRIIDEGQFTLKDAMLYFKQMLLAINTCHRVETTGAHGEGAPCGIVHRDLKPENFLFRQKKGERHGEEVVVIDFGLASKIKPGFNFKTKAGTPYYVAPQVLKGKYTEKCDVWSLGVILFIMMSGFPPFFGDTDKEILTKVKAGFDPNTMFPTEEEDGVTFLPEVERLITRMLTMDESRRPSLDYILNEDPDYNKLMKMVDPDDDLFDATLSSQASSAVEHMRLFFTASTLQKVFMTKLAQSLSAAELGNLPELFKKMDKNGDGKLSLQEMTDGLNSIDGIDASALGNLQEWFNGIDADQSGVLEYDEFITACMNLEEIATDAKLESLFRNLDHDGNGKLDAQELFELAGDIDGDGQMDQWEFDNIERWIKESGFDQNEDGEIDKDEFFAMMRGKKNVKTGRTMMSNY